MNKKKYRLTSRGEFVTTALAATVIALALSAVIWTFLFLIAV